MDPEDLEPLRKKPQPKNLEPMSVAELEEYIAGLQAEIVRAQAMIQSKRQGRSGAESLFRK